MVFPAIAPSSPLLGFNFAVTLAESDDVAGAIAGPGVRSVAAGFQEITGLEGTLEVQEYKEGGRNDFTHRFISSANFGNITFKRGVALTPDLWSWFDQVRRGSFGARRAIMIAHLNTERQPAVIWYLSRALPTKYSGPSWNSGQSSVAVESLEVTHEGLELLTGADFGT